MKRFLGLFHWQILILQNSSVCDFHRLKIFQCFYNYAIPSYIESIPDFILSGLIVTWSTARTKGQSGQYSNYATRCLIHSRGVKWLKCEAEHSPTFSAKVKNKRSCLFTPPIHFNGVYRQNFYLYHQVKHSKILCSAHTVHPLYVFCMDLRINSNYFPVHH